MFCEFFIFNIQTFFFQAFHITFQQESEGLLIRFFIVPANKLGRFFNPRQSRQAVCIIRVKRAHLQPFQIGLGKLAVNIIGLKLLLYLRFPVLQVFRCK